MIASKHENWFQQFQTRPRPKNNRIWIVIVYWGAIGEIWDDFVS